MARDYKHAGKSKASSSLSGRLASPGWAWFVAGLLIGLFVTALTYLSIRHSAEDAGRQVGAESQLRGAHPSTPREKPAKSADKTAKPTDKSPGPKFEFYTILPERELRVPESELRSQQSKAPQKSESSEQKTDPALPSHTSGRYILQVGSFRNLEDADRLKAKLALGGFDVEIQTISMNGGDSWYRVRLGPYKDTGAVYRIRTELQKNGLAPLVLKEKE